MNGFIEQEGVPPSGPLMSWDIYMYMYQRKMQQMESLHGIKEMAKKHQWKVEWDLEKELVHKQKVILVTDLSLSIRYASSNLLEMNGYNPGEVVGKNPRMFQGPDTAVETKNQIKEALLNQVPFHGSIVNYRKDGSPYDCIIEEYPIWNKSGHLVHFIAFEQVA
ncbi:MAG: PAS domain-containing protein [Chitinophagaceae bacterium]